jgi:DNA-binding GntR family transcriptional regulator
MADEHLQILEALLANDADRAVELLDQHLTSGQAMALDYL